MLFASNNMHRICMTAPAILRVKFLRILSTIHGLAENDNIYILSIFLCDTFFFCKTIFKKRNFYL